jgi:hypothetical protein
MAAPYNSFLSPQTAKTAFVNSATANTDFDTAPANAVLLLTAGARGGRLVRLQAVPCETVTASHCQLYRSADGGTTKYLAAGVLMGAATINGTNAATPTDFGYSEDNPLIMSANEKLYVAPGIAKSTNFIAEWGDF